MRREGTVEELTDGKRYRSSDLARLGTSGCAGCSSCCYSRGDTIVLDAWDWYQLAKGLTSPPEQLIESYLQLSVVDGVILPCINMIEGHCGFLGADGRCTVHAFRPGFCRMFPLGRLYEDGGFSYVLLKNECYMEHRSKVRIDRWLDIPELKRYEKFVLDWHTLVKKLEKRWAENMECRKKENLLFLRTFFFQPYHLENEFYPQLEIRWKEFTDTLQM